MISEHQTNVDTSNVHTHRLTL